MISASIIIPSFQRNNLLRWNLESLASQKVSDIETIVLDDSFKPDQECEALSGDFGCRYIHTGNTKVAESWRMPGFAINIGARAAKGEHLILCSAEVYHMGDTIPRLIEHAAPDAVVIPRSVVDDRGTIIYILESGGPVSSSDLRRLKSLDARLPFLMCVSRELFVSIGGYDEDFTGVCWDDNDITDRLTSEGRKYITADAQVVHLFHPRHDYQSPEIKARWNHNKSLYDTRRGALVRNQDREWGSLK